MSARPNCPRCANNGKARPLNQRNRCESCGTYLWPSGDYSYSPVDDPTVCGRCHHVVYIHQDGKCRCGCDRNRQAPEPGP